MIDITLPTPGTPRTVRNPYSDECIKLRKRCAELEEELEAWKAYHLECATGQSEVVEGLEGVHLTRNHEKLVRALIRAMPHYLTRDQLMDAIYTNVHEDEWPQHKIIDVYVCSIRKNIRKVGARLTIETVRGRGHKMVVSK